MQLRSAFKGEILKRGNTSLSPRQRHSYLWSLRNKYEGTYFALDNYRKMRYNKAKWKHSQSSVLPQAVESDSLCFLLHKAAKSTATETYRKRQKADSKGYLLHGSGKEQQWVTQ